MSVGHLGRRPRCDHDPARADPRSAGRERPLSDESRFLADHFDPQPLEALDRIVRRDRSDDFVHMRMHFGKVDARFGHDAEGACRFGVACATRRGKERFGGYASGVQALTAHFAALDQHRLRTGLRRDPGGGQPCRAGTDDTDVGVDLARHAKSP